MISPSHSALSSMPGPILSSMSRSSMSGKVMMDGMNTKENLSKALKLAKEVCKKIYEIQKKALKEKYSMIGESK